MSSSLTSWGATRIIGTFFASTYTPPASFYVALCMQAPDNEADGTMLTEPASAAAYARVNVANTSANFSTPTSGVITNLANVAWPTATADWGVVTHYAFCDSATGGNCYFWAGLSLPRLVQSGHLTVFNPGLLNIFLTTQRAQLVGLHPQ